MRKKNTYIIIGMMAGVLLFTACGKNKEQADTGAVVIPKEVTVSENAWQEIPSNEELKEQSGGAKIAVKIEQKEESLEQEDGTRVFYYEYEVPVIDSVGYEKLKEAVEKWTAEEKAIADKEVKEYQEWAQQDEFSSNYSYNAYVSTTRADSAIVSFEKVVYVYSGGAHGNAVYYGVAFDSQSGQKLSLEDIVTDKTAFQKAAREIADEVLAQEMYAEGLFEDYEKALTGLIENPENFWYLTDQGITIVSNQYLIGPYAMGVIKFAIPYEKLAGAIQEKYLPVSEEAVVSLDDSSILYIDLNGDGVLDRISVNTAYDSMNTLLTVNDATIQGGVPGYFKAGNVIRKQNGKGYILLTVDEASDDNYTHLYRLDGDKLVECDAVFAGIKSGTVTGNGFTLRTYIDVLGTYSGERSYAISNDDKLVTNETMFLLDNGPDAEYRRGPTTLKEVSVLLEGEQTLLPTGTVLYPSACDNKGVLQFLLEDGKQGELKYEKEEYEIFINGISENELFENLPYAG